MRGTEGLARVRFQPDQRNRPERYLFGWLFATAETVDTVITDDGRVFQPAHGNAERAA